MSKKCVAIIIILLFTLTGCSSQTENMHEKIHNKFYNMPSYSAECTLTVFSNKTENVYTYSCYYDSSLDKYKIDYADKSVIISDTSAQIIKNNSISQVSVNQSDMLIFINTFFKSYYMSENTSMKASGSENMGITTLECDVINPDKFANTMKLHIRNEDVNPVRMNIYDKSGKETINVVFNDFKITKNTNIFGGDN